MTLALHPMFFFVTGALRIHDDNDDDTDDIYLVRLLGCILPLRQGGIQCPDGHREKDSRRCPLFRAMAAGDESKFSRRSAVDWLRAATHRARTAPAPSRVAEVAAVQRLSSVSSVVKSAE